MSQSCFYLHIFQIKRFHFWRWIHCFILAELLCKFFFLSKSISVSFDQHYELSFIHVNSNFFYLSMKNFEYNFKFEASLYVRKTSGSLKSKQGIMCGRLKLSMSGSKPNVALVKWIIMITLLYFCKLDILILSCALFNIIFGIFLYFFFVLVMFVKYPSP